MSDHERSDGGGHDTAEPTGTSGPTALDKPPRIPAPKLERGTLIGRYVVVDVLGEGGMGVVYAAYDPELDRKVAIKLLQGGSRSHGDQGWLQREAQALGRLAHPNVIAVHDVGTLDDRVWVAMELVDGTTLRLWRQLARSWREVQAVMLAAGAGLSAAHHAGLIHRDFKPENVLVGADGRVRVMDFGLARNVDFEEPAARTSDLEIAARSPLAESLTIAGSVLGTPAYMAPEIFEASPASPRSDQFAFGVTLYEMLYQQRPYAKRAFATLPRPEHLEPRPAPKSDVPARIHRVAMRAIALDPEQRFASMDELLAELAIDPLARRRQLVLGGVGASFIGAVVVATIKLSSPAVDRTQLCKGVERHLVGVWDPAVRSKVKAAFAATDRPFKDNAFTAITTSLDRYTTQWTAAVTESCEATQLRGEQAEEVQALRQDCFDERLAVLGSFTKQLASADDALVDKASNGALALEREESVARCADVVALKLPNQPTEDIRAQVRVAKDKLAEAHGAVLTGNYGRGINAATEAGKLAKAIPFEPVYAEAELVRGSAIMQLGNLPDALVAMEAAAWSGLAGKRDDVTANAAIYMAFMLANNVDKRAEAQLWSALSKAAIERVGSPPVLELLHLQTEGVLRANRGDLIGAAQSHRKAFERALTYYGKDNPQLAQSHLLLGATLAAIGDFVGALPHYEAAVRMASAWLGADHPDTALMHSGLANCYHHTGQAAKARAEFRIALEIRERVFGPNSPILIPTLNNTAELFADEGELEQALVLATRAKQLVERALGKSNPYFPTVLATYGEILFAMKRYSEARTAFDDALAVAERTKAPVLGVVLADRAKLARAETQWKESAGYDERAIAALEASTGKTAVDLWKPLTGLALAKLHDGKPAEARPLLERALAVAKGKVPESSLKELTDAIARTR